MYNRYIPQPDGSYRRNRVSDPRPPEPPKPAKPPKQDSPAPQSVVDCPPPPPPKPRPQRKEHHCHNRKEVHTESSISDFLKRLLPKDFDTGDLLIIILLLLMAGDCAEDQNTALLTLALYLFM
jgi:hypothetical protein